jgi:hypothetical protein
MKYIIKLITLCLLMLACVGLFNWFADPYGMQWSTTIAGFNKQKTEAGNRARIIKPIRVEKVNPEVLLVGNSRIEIGIRAESNSFTGNTVYNLGIPGAIINTQLSGANTQLLNNHNLQHLILSLDFRNFIFKYTSIKNLNDLELRYALKEKGIKEKINFYNSILFSLDALKSSFKTISKQNSLSNDISPLGTNSAGDYQSVIFSEGLNVLMAHQLKELRKKMLRPYMTYTGQLFSENFGIELLDHFLTSHAKTHVRLSLFINPYHHSYLHILQETGHWESFIAWKTEMARLADKHSNVEFYDFSLFNQYTNEKPNLTKLGQPMKWFWEPAHYRSEYGEMILDVLANKKSKYPLAIKLSSDTLATVIKNNQTGIIETKDIWKELKEQDLKL